MTDWPRLLLLAAIVIALIGSVAAGLSAQLSTERLFQAGRNCANLGTQAQARSRLDCGQ